MAMCVLSGHGFVAGTFHAVVRTIRAQDRGTAAPARSLAQTGSGLRAASFAAQGAPSPGQDSSASSSTTAAPGAATASAFAMERQPSAEELDRVMKTCRATAGMRAIEGLRAVDPIIVDHLAEVLAGPEQRQRFADTWDKKMAEEGESKHFYFAGRARILDDRITALLGKMAADETGQARPLLQVVSLGCGADTRPWRLDLPAATRWFDVDQAPVITIKRRLLQESGAALDHTAVSTRPVDGAVQRTPANTPAVDRAAADGARADGAAADGAGAANEGQAAANGDSTHSSSCSFPLKVGRGYVMVAADLSEPSWVVKLEAAGFDAGAPTLWVAEGLLYYLLPEANIALLEAAAQHSPMGSYMLCTMIPDENLQANHNCPKTHFFHNIFKASVKDVVQSGGMAKAGWSDITVTPDLAVVLQQQYGIKAYEPYDKMYTYGKPLDVEVVVEAVKAA